MTAAAIAKPQDCSRQAVSILEEIDMFLHDYKWHNPKVAEWVYRLMNGP